jgi:hypothetical protein
MVITDSTLSLVAVIFLTQGAAVREASYVVPFEVLTLVVQLPDTKVSTSFAKLLASPTILNGSLTFTLATPGVVALNTTRGVVALVNNKSFAIPILGSGALVLPLSPLSPPPHAAKNAVMLKTLNKTNLFIVFSNNESKEDKLHLSTDGSVSALKR